jgi:hypothetical protein
MASDDAHCLAHPVLATAPMQTGKDTHAIGYFFTPVDWKYFNRRTAEHFEHVMASARFDPGALLRQ